MSNLFLCLILWRVLCFVGVAVLIGWARSTGCAVDDNYFCLFYLLWWLLGGRVVGFGRRIGLERRGATS